VNGHSTQNTINVCKGLDKQGNTVAETFFLLVVSSMAKVGKVSEAKSVFMKQQRFLLDSKIFSYFMQT